jgi:cysteine desulfurase
MRIYLDFNASTPVAPEVAAAMQAVLDAPFGNPSSDHWAGKPARDAVQRARTRVAGLLGCDAGEVVFTSGGSEANNHALKGIFFAKATAHPHIITTQVEHPAVINPCRFLERLGAKVTYLPVDALGRVDPEDLRRAVTPATILISVMHANNEVGTTQPIADISRIAREHGIVFHTDAAQSVGKIPTKVRELDVDLLGPTPVKGWRTGRRLLATQAHRRQNTKPQNAHDHSGAARNGRSARAPGSRARRARAAK